MIAQHHPRNFIAHIEITAADPTPAMQSGLYDSVGQFFAVTGLHSDLDAPFEKFDPPPATNGCALATPPQRPTAPTPQPPPPTTPTSSPHTSKAT